MRGTGRRGTTNNPRDSDASFSSMGTTNQRSSSSMGRNPSIQINDKSYQNHALKSINSYLSSHSTSFHLKPPLPSAKDITSTLRFILFRLSFTDSSSSSSVKIEEDVPILLNFLNCPIRINKSVLKNPGIPHSWPSLLAVIHWLVQCCIYNDHIGSTTMTTTTRSLNDNKLLDYTLRSYSHYISGEDDEVDALDDEFIKKLESERMSVENKVKLLLEEITELEKKIESLRWAPSAREVLEKEKSMLEEDIKKFHAIINEYTSRIEIVDNELKVKEKELDAKVEENRRICEENDELKKRIEAQTVNMRDADRMKKELQAIERDITEAEVERSAWEEKAWDLDSQISHKFKELENLPIDCNQAIRRLKLGNEYQYLLNPEGSTPTDVLGIDYKTLKVALNALSEDIKKSSVAKFEELIFLQQQSTENAAKLEAKRNHLVELQSKIDMLESHLSLMRKESEDFTSKCAVEAKRMSEEVERERHNVEMMEREAEEFVKISKTKLQFTIKQQVEEIQMCARELLSLVDSASKYKEHMESIISDMKTALSETVEAVANAFEGSLPAGLGTSGAIQSHEQDPNMQARSTDTQPSK
ncbi:kinetochore protein NDC80 homolog isoform X1 [Papaver somniferum]|uniref:kinetochore protein NDC80 homolog isoform X1 n=1 Tax=Papaver somniferum TaxID=3469 RepID=UPI000E6FE813|nr:kinetochore protein NDC80 homolog isoform X1 [Papaver somniferum]